MFGRKKLLARIELLESGHNRTLKKEDVYGKMEFDTILRCANADCCHNRDGYNCTCSVIALNSEGQCAPCKPKRKPIPEVKTITKFPDGTESETTNILI